jgi:predicted permease
MISRRRESLATRVFRAGLLWFPPRIRRAHGDEMVAMFETQWAKAGARGWPARLWLALRATSDLVTNGTAARFAALGSRKLGRPAKSVHAMGGRGTMGMHDVVLTIRRLARARLFVMVTLTTLTIGLGMFAVVYTAVDKVLLEPMPYPHAGDLYYVWRDYGPIRDQPRGALPGTDVLDLQAAGGVIEHVVALQAFLGGVFSSGGDEEAMEISAVVTSPGLFELLGVEPQLGRVFGPDDAGPGRPFTMVLTHELWTRLGADPGMVGREVSLNGRPHTIIGVLPREFDFVRADFNNPPQRADAYTNLRVNLTDPSPNLADYSVLMRVSRGTAPEAVAAAVEAVGRGVDERDFEGRGLRLYAAGLKADLVDEVRPALLVVGAAGVVLALMLLVNLASVLLARAAQREHEFAVSRAMGASRSATARGPLLEGVLLGLAGGAMGAIAGIWGTRTLVSLMPSDFPRREAILLDWSVGIAVVVVGGLLGALAAMAPARWATRTALPSLLASSSVRGGGGHGRMRRGMVVAQVALSLVLLNSGALVVMSLQRLLSADPGFRPEGVLTILVRTPPVFIPNAQVVEFQNRVAGAFATVPGVTRVSAAAALPLTEATTFEPTSIELPEAPGNTGDPARDAVLTDVIGVRAGYFEVMGMRLVAGRTFGESEAAAPEAVIDEAFAERFFPGVDPVGQALFRRPTAEGETRADRGPTVVGVVQQARIYDAHQDGRPQLYMRITNQFFQRPLYYVIATEGDPETLVPALRAALRGVDPRVAMGEPRTMEDIVASALLEERAGAVLLAAFGFGAVLLVIMGVFGVVAGSVTRRHHELAVRLTVGANPRQALGLIVRETVWLVGIGIAIGIPGIYAASGLLRGALIGVSPSDPFIVALVAVKLALATLATGYFAARRVLEIDPARVLQAG